MFYLSLSLSLFPFLQGNPKARIRQRRKRRRILMLVLVVCAFAISWLPLHVFHILSDAGIISYNYQIFMVVSARRRRRGKLRVERVTTN